MKLKEKGILYEFKMFISRGNVMDMAVGIIIGTAFTAIVNSLVNDIIMPFIGYIIRGINFSSLRFIMKEAEGDVAEVALLYGKFIQNIINFLIIAFVVFIILKGMNRLIKKREEKPAAPAEPAADIKLLTEIRDLLKK